MKIAKAFKVLPCISLLLTLTACGGGGGSSDSSDGPDTAEIDALVSRREALRVARDFAAADEIRDQLEKAGIVIEDNADGPRWRRTR